MWKQLLKQFIQVIQGPIGGILISILIAYFYYRKSGKELKEHVESLSKQIDILERNINNLSEQSNFIKDVNSKLEHNIDLQMERNYKLDNNERAKTIKNGTGYGLNTSNSVSSCVNVVNENNPNLGKGFTDDPHWEKSCVDDPAGW